MTRILDVPGAFNLRDIAATPMAGAVLRRRQIYRSDLLHRVDVERARAWLAEAGVGRVIDLRTTQERETDGYLESDGTFESLHHPLLDEVWSWEEEHTDEGDHFLRDRTIEMYENHADRILTVLEAVAGESRAVVFHCTAGKDRTGVIASALFGVLGLSAETIVEDYAASAVGLPDMMAYYRNLRPDAPFDAERAERHLRRAATAETMAGVVDHVEQVAGSIREWARAAGLASATMDRLSDRLRLDGDPRT